MNDVYVQRAGRNTFDEAEVVTLITG